jgi:phosphatidylglycerol:prolipoprotein diacylglycerol transferase
MNPVMVEIGLFQVRYYGLMYVLAFVISFYLILFRIKKENRFDVSREQIATLSTYMIAGVFIGGRLGYVLFYNLPYYTLHPLEIFLPFEFTNPITFTGISGMSYHGGLAGVILSAWLYIRKAGLDYWEIADLVVPVIPLGYTLGRLGNFINGELFGRITTLPIGMYFPLAGSLELRHPSQLYEAVFEGFFLFALLWNIRLKKLPKGAMLAVYLIGYGAVRFFIEYFRQPDAHLGFVIGSFTMGQALCCVMIVSGTVLYRYLFLKSSNTI